MSTKSHFQNCYKARWRTFGFDAMYLAEDTGSNNPELRNFHYLINYTKQDFGIEGMRCCILRRRWVVILCQRSRWKCRAWIAWKGGDGR